MSLGKRILTLLNEGQFKTIADAPAPRVTRLRRANTEIAKMPQYQRHIDIDGIFAICRKNGFEPVDEDGSPWSGLFTGRDGKAHIKLRDDGTSSVKPRREQMPWLQISWHKMDVSGNYEVVAYVN